MPLIKAGGEPARNLFQKPFERLGKSYSSARGVKKIMDPPERDGDPAMPHRCYSSGQPIYTIYYVSRHGCFQSMFADPDDGGLEPADRVWEVDYIGDDDKTVLGQVEIRLTDADPMEDDVLPATLLYSMKLEGGEIAAMAKAYEEFWTHAIAAHKAEQKEEAGALADSTDMSADQLFTGTNDSLDGVKDVAETIAERTAQLYVEGADRLATTGTGVTASPEFHRRATDIDPVEEATPAAADMSAAFHDVLGQAAQRLLERHPELVPVQYGAAVTEAVTSKLLTEYDLSSEIDRLVRFEDETRRISGIVVEEIRADRWKIKLYCREGGIKGRATSSHTVHITPGMFTVDYRVTGAKKYPHQLEVISFVTACLHAVFTRLV